MMKKLISLLMTAVLIFALAACGQTRQTESTDSSAADAQPSSTPGSTETTAQSVPETIESSEIPDADEKTLIVYFSWSTSGNTEKMAAYIQEQTGGDLLELEPLNLYWSSFFVTLCSINTYL